MSVYWMRALDYVISVTKEVREHTHPYQVLLEIVPVPDERYEIVAILHDIVEDGYTTFDDLQKRFELDAEQMAALDAITRRQGEKYFDYIRRCKQNEMATVVKLADLKDNIKSCTNDLPNRWGLLRRYAKAYGMLIDKRTGEHEQNT